LRTRTWTRQWDGRRTASCRCSRLYSSYGDRLSGPTRSFNQGQVCCAGSRIFVQESIHDAFLEKFTAKAKSLKISDPFDEGAYYGPQISQTQFDRVLEYIESGRKDGAKVHLGGDRLGKDGFFINSTILTDTTPDMRVVKEEIFGPVAVIIKFKDEAGAPISLPLVWSATDARPDVLRQANDTMYGLAASVFSQNIDRALATAHQLHAGTVWVNCSTMIDPQMPFGGFKQSGIGRECGEYALAKYVPSSVRALSGSRGLTAWRSYTNVKAVHVNLGGSAP
jgi:aldehyde dehydrogenase (NAD+)